MKYRKKPVVIDAIQFNGLNVAEIHRFTNAKLTDSSHNDDGPAVSIAIHTLEGTMTATPGDWIIRGVKGEFYPCKPDIFEATYERVREVAHYPDGMGEESRRIHREYNALVAAQNAGAKNGADVVRLTDEANAKGIILVPNGENL